MKPIVFGRWTALSIDNNKARCVCDCGTRRLVAVCDLKRGASRSCGCLQRERTGDASRIHGQSRTRLYVAWRGMHTRCSNPNATNFKNYGGRGIAVCARWSDFAAFISDMGPRPEGMSLDRIDNNGPYAPTNCRWATRFEQSGNSRRARSITINGVTKCLSEWCKEYGVNYRAALGRLRLGWPAAVALKTPSVKGKCARLTKVAA